MSKISFSSHFHFCEPSVDITFVGMGAEEVLVDGDVSSLSQVEQDMEEFVAFDAEGRGHT